MNWNEIESCFATKEDVLYWFGDRGIFLEKSKTKGRLHLSKYKWIRGKLFYAIKGEHDGCQSIEITPPYYIEMCQTHREDGSSIIVHEAYQSWKATFKDIPQLIKKIEEEEKIKKAEWEEYIKQKDAESRQKNIELFSNLKVGDILTDGYNWQPWKLNFLQVVTTDIKNGHVMVKKLNSYWKYPPERKDGKFPGWGGITANKDDFVKPSKTSELDLNHFNYSLWDGTPQNT